MTEVISLVALKPKPKNLGSLSPDPFLCDRWNMGLFGVWFRSVISAQNELVTTFQVHNNSPSETL